MINKKADVAVVIPCYRSALNVARAVESVCIQTVLPQKVILVDDFSDDNGATLYALHTLKEKYKEIIDVEIIQLSENIGAAGARNLGWNKATTKYVAFLDSDDAWHPKKIEIQYNLMINYPDLVMSGHQHRVSKEANKLPTWELGRWKVITISKQSLLLSNKFITPSIMIKRDISQRFNDNQRFMEDHSLWLDIAYETGSIVKISADLAAVYKRLYGVSGLSSNMWQMERNELGNYHRLYAKKHISFVTWLGISVYSLLKYYRRLFLTMFLKS